MKYDDMKYDESEPRVEPSRFRGGYCTEEFKSNDESTNQWMQECREAKKQLAAKQKEIEQLHNTIAFFACVIKCGEPWTNSCQQAFDDVFRIDNER